MRKIKIDKDYTLTNDLILDLINKHSTEKSRLEKLLRYYNNENDKINNRVYKNKNKPQNRLSHPYAQYITDTATGYLLGKPIAYTTEDEKLLEELADIFKYNDEADNNTTLAKMASIYGYAYEIMYIDKFAKPRFKDEIYNYVWQKGKDDPVKQFDDVLDSLRYAIYSESKRNGKMFDRNKYNV